MNRLASTLLLLGLAAPSAHATDFGPLMDTARQAWPEKTRICVLANYVQSRQEINDLAAGAGAGAVITVLNMTRPDQIDRATSLALTGNRHDFIVLLPNDPFVRDGSPYASRIVSRAAMAGIPAIATTPLAMHQGAVFAVGLATGYTLLVTDRVGVVTVPLPQKGTFVNPVARLDRGMADIQVIGGLER